LDEGYACDWYTSAEKFPLNNIMHYHIFLVDVMLPGENGFTFVKRLRNIAPVGVIFLTAR
jgi:DNA-binding response OmpR family regulator